MSVEANEVLVVKGIMKKMEKFLSVQSLKHGEKHLHVQVKCDRHFSTAPKDVGMHIMNMMKYRITFPQRAVIFPDGEIDRSLSLDMTKFPVTLGKLVRETSMIASSIFESNYEVTPVMEVLLSLDIRVEQLSEDEHRQLHDHTSTLHHNFSSSNVQLFFAEMPSSRAYDLQLLYKKLLVGQEADSTTLELPSLLLPVQPLPYEMPAHRNSSVGVPVHAELQQPPSIPSSPIRPLQQPSPPAPSTSEGSITDELENLYHTIDMTKRHS